jgi:hypothetical protein
MFRVVFWDKLPCKMIVDCRFRGAYCLHHQGCSTIIFTRQYIPEDNSEHHTRRRKNLKSHTAVRKSKLSAVLPTLAVVTFLRLRQWCYLVWMQVQFFTSCVLMNVRLLLAVRITERLFRASQYAIRNVQYTSPVDICGLPDLGASATDPVSLNLSVNCREAFLQTSV